MKCDLCNEDSTIFLSYAVEGDCVKYCCKKCWHKLNAKK